jgi:mannose-6-phosphate isomerase-like protein (cupin superfamily)
VTEAFRRGCLEPPEAAPELGERFIAIVKLGGARVEQILSGALVEPAVFEQAHDEWVLIVAGSARLRVDGEELELRAGEWLLLPAGCPHVVLEAEPGTSWLALHGVQG